MLTLTMLTLTAGVALADTPPEPEPLLAEVPSEAPVEVAPVAPRAPNQWLADQQVRVEGVANDLFAMGQTVDLAGTVQDNVFAMGQTVQLEGEGRVDGDLIAMGQVIRVDRPVSGDVYGLGEIVEVGPQGVVGGDLYAGAGEVVIEGAVRGDVAVSTGELHLGPGASVGGDLSYAAREEVDIPDGVVAGGVSFEKIEEPAEASEAQEPSVLASAFWGLLGLVFAYASSMLVGSVLIALLGERLSRAVRLVRDDMARSAGLGFVIAVVLPVASVVAMILLLPFPLGLMGLAVWVAGLYVAKLVVAWALGDALLRQVRPGAVGTPYVSLAIGLLPLLLALEIPWLGALLWLGVVAVGLGAIWSGTIRGE